jgi:hypothetical protein
MLSGVFRTLNVLLLYLIPFSAGGLFLS